MNLKRSHYAPERTTLLLVRGTCIAVLLLGSLLLLYNGIKHPLWLSSHVWVLGAISLYLLIAALLLRRKHLQFVSWMLIAFYVFLAFFTLLMWGLNAPVGIFTVSFAVILPSILMGTRSILPVAGLAILVLVGVQILHTAGVVSPNLKNLSLISTYWDVATYSTILSIFALVSWLASNQREKNLKRALVAEAELQIQKEALSTKLEEESAVLRLTQLNQIRHLHKFALLGQSTAATLHELSNHLSILNFDIDDLRQQHSNSKAIAHAKDSIDYINNMVRQARQQLSSYEHHENFNAISIVNQSIKDLRKKFRLSHVNLTQRQVGHAGVFRLSGNPLALMQIITILLNNALDACYQAQEPTVELEIKNTKSRLYISVLDNGEGLAKEVEDSLFNPVKSSKSSGLGIGLYIAQHLAKDQFNGTISVKRRKVGAHFVVAIPRQKRTTNPKDTSPKTSRTRQQPHALHSTGSK